MSLQDLRDLECLIALARHRHFARAARQCGLSQPAFSARIQGLEERLDTKIVKRGNRFLGLTSEGETVLAHAKTIIAQVRALEEEVRASRGEITGSLTLGAVPTAAAHAARIAHHLRQIHPGIRTRVDTCTSLAVQQGVYDGRFDAGITYCEGASTDLLDIDPLYDERYVLFLPAAMAPPGQDEISWGQAAELPLILLEPDMQNRRIIDQVFRDIGAQLNLIAETGGFTAAVAMASSGMGATVIPQVLVDSLGEFRDARFLPLVDPVVEKSVCMISLTRDTRVPVVIALRRMLSAE